LLLQVFKGGVSYFLKTSGNYRLESAGLDAVKGRFWGES